MIRQGQTTVERDSEVLRRALKRLPEPQPRPGFVDRALANASGPATHATNPVVQLVSRWETWIGAAVGATVASVVTLLLLRAPEQLASPSPGITLALNEARAIDVLIDSERTLEDATIRIVAIGSVALDGFENDREIGWQTHLDRGNNVLSLPVVARSAGEGRLVAVIEHAGRTRWMTINLTVLDT
jgi:hypothetical protein